MKRIVQYFIVAIIGVSVMAGCKSQAEKDKKAKQDEVAGIIAKAASLNTTNKVFSENEFKTQYWDKVLALTDSDVDAAKELALAAAAAVKIDFNQIAAYDGIDGKMFIYSVDGIASYSALNAFASKQQHATGISTAYFFYNPNTEMDNVAIAGASDWHTALGLGCVTGCIAGYWNFAAGVPRFVERPCD